MDTDSFIVHVKTYDIYREIAEDVETRFDTSNFELDRPLYKGKNEIIFGLMKGAFGGQIMNEFVRLRAKTDSNLKESNVMKIKKQKGQKNVS